MGRFFIGRLAVVWARMSEQIDRQQEQDVGRDIGNHARRRLGLGLALLGSLYLPAAWAQGKVNEQSDEQSGARVVSFTQEARPQRMTLNFFGRSEAQSREVQLTLVLMRGGDAPRYLGCDQVDVRVGGMRVGHQEKIESSTLKVGVVEYIYVPLRSRDLQPLLLAQRLDYSICGDSGSATAKEMAGVREVLKRLGLL